MNEKGTRFRGLHSYFKHGTHFVWIYGTDGELLAELHILVGKNASDTSVKVLVGQVAK